MAVIDAVHATTDSFGHVTVQYASAQWMRYPCEWNADVMPFQTGNVSTINISANRTFSYNDNTVGRPVI